MLGNTPELPADPGSYLDQVKGQLTGDVVFGNLEGTLTDVSDSPKCGGDALRRLLRLPHAAELRALPRRRGFTVMNNANNHSYDFGQAGWNRRSRRCTRPGSPRTACPARSRW